jgi:hypothetical protein
MALANLRSLIGAGIECPNIQIRSMDDKQKIGGTIDMKQ